MPLEYTQNSLITLRKFRTLSGKSIAVKEDNEILTTQSYIE